MNYRKLLAIIGLIVFTIASLYGIYYIFFIWNVEPGGEVGEVGEGGQLPGIGSGFDAPIGGIDGQLPEGVDRPGPQLPGTDAGQEEEPISDIARGGLTKMLPISSDIVQDPELQVGDQGFVYYNPLEGKFYRQSIDGERRTPLSDEIFYSVDEVTWSRDQSKAVLEYPDGSNIIYDFARGGQVTLPQQAQDFSFSNDNDSLVYEYIGGSDDSNYLTVSKSNGTEAEFVQALGENADRVQVNWSPASRIIAMFRKSAGLNEEEIFFLGKQQENFKSIIVRGSKFEGIWSPLGSRILYSVVSPETDYNPSLWTVEALGENIGKNHFPLFLQTWVDKCAFSSDGLAVYCGVPNDLVTGTGLDRSILDPAIGDDIYRIDLTTGQRQFVARPVNTTGTSVDIGSLFVPKDEDYLMLWDTITRTVYKVRLK